jgi:hypothetical protein
VFPPTLDLQPQGPPGQFADLVAEGLDLVPTTKVQHACAREQATASRCPPCRRMSRCKPLRR